MVHYRSQIFVNTEKKTPICTSKPFLIDLLDLCRVVSSNYHGSPHFPVLHCIPEFRAFHSSVLLQDVWVVQGCLPGSRLPCCGSGEVVWKLLPVDFWNNDLQFSFFVWSYQRASTVPHRAPFYLCVVSSAHIEHIFRNILVYHLSSSLASLGVIVQASNPYTWYRNTDSTIAAKRRSFRGLESDDFHILIILRHGLHAAAVRCFISLSLSFSLYYASMRTQVLEVADLC